MKPTIFYNFIKQQNLLFVLLFFVGTLQSQTTPEVLWVKRYGGPNIDGVSDIATDDLGNIYITGLFWHDTDFEGITLATSGLGAPFVAKTDPSGNILWAKQFGSSGMNSGKGIDIDNQGNVYTTGTFIGIANFDSFTFDAGSSNDVFVLKQDSSGNVIWVTAFTTPHNSGSITSESIVVDTQGNVYTAGYFYSDSVTFGNITIYRSDQAITNAFITKQDNLGNVIWVKKIDTTENVSIGKITLDTYGNIYITGQFSGTLDFGDYTPTNSDSISDIFLLKINSSGEYIWAKQFEVNSQLYSDNETRSYSVIVDDVTENIYIVGRFKGTLHAETTILTSNPNSRNPFIIKTNNLGQILWAKKIESTDDSSALDITINTSGKIYIAGIFFGTIDFEGILLSSAGSDDAFVLKMNDLGSIEWVVKYGSIERDVASRVTVDVNGNILVAGVFKHVVDFGGTMLSSAGGSADLFLLKLSPNALSTQKNQINNLSVFPNPTDDFVTLHFPDLDNKTFSVEIFNLLGQKIKTFENLNNTETIDLSQLTSGIYLLKINDNQTTKTIKIKKL